MPQLPDASTMVRLSPEEAQDLGVRSLCRLGYTEDEAGTIAAHLVDAALCGYRFAGLPRILNLAQHVKNNGLGGPITVVRETEVSAVINGNNNTGYLVVPRATRIAIEKAKAKGFALVGVYNSRYSGRNGAYLEKIARADLVGVHTACGNSRVAPPGGMRPVFGTNPIAFGFPSTRDPVIFDMGTAAMMTGELQRRAWIGEKLPAGIAIDAAGLPTTDANEALKGALLHFAGYKGYGLSLTIQLLGLAGGVAAGTEGIGGSGYFFIVFDPGLLVPVDEFKAQVSALVDWVKSTPRQPGVEEIRIPSERAFRARERNRVEGIRMDRALYDALNAL
jgi:LDH2 family malate/lactate/ureidoglycolate dehydrogenase